MKISNWCRKLSAAIMAAGIYVPSLAFAVDIPLGDPSFDDYAVPPRIGYAYSNEYRPTSAWVDDLDNPGGGTQYVEDDGFSNWLYNANYAENATNSRRASPRTGNQAMHGIGYYSAQETSAVFEANHTYTFSLWAQGDEIIDDPGNSSGVFMYIFDGGVPFSDANSLATDLLTSGAGDFADRAPGMTPAQSQANWTQISISHYVARGAPEIGSPVGVGFFVRRDGAVDDASLSVVPEPTTVVLVGMGMAGVALLGRRRR